MSREHSFWLISILSPHQSSVISAVHLNPHDLIPSFSSLAGAAISYHTDLKLFE